MRVALSVSTAGHAAIIAHAERWIEHFIEAHHGTTLVEFFYR